MKNDFLYPYQESIVKKALKSNMKKGRIILPTGSGKGVICREIFYRMITSLRNKNNQFLGIVFTPRLILNKQWITDFIKYFENQSHPLNFVFVGSESMSRRLTNQIEDILYKINGAGVDCPISTLDYREIKKAVSNNKRKGINTIVISTYHSNGVVRKANLDFNCAIYDEAHYLPGRENPSGVQIAKEDLFSATEIKSNKKIFTTATEKIADVDEGKEYHGRGMNNEDIYGKEIMTWEDEDENLRRISPRDLIEFGSMLEPLVHVITTDVNLKKYDLNDDICNVNKIIPKNCITEKEFEEKAKVIEQSFRQHEQRLLTDSSYPEKIGAKMLVVSNGSAEIEGLRDAMEDFREKNEDIKCYYISSYTGVDMPGEENQRVNNKSKEQMLDSLKLLRSEDKAIIFHIDIMTCGLDIPALTGVLFFKSCNTIKLLQNIGRACRLHDEDRKKWENKEIFTGGDGYIKPNFYIILPVLFENQDDFVNQFGKTISKIRDNYDFKSWEFVRIGKIGQPPPVPTEDDNGIIQGIKSLKSKINRRYLQLIEDKKALKRQREEERKQMELEKDTKEGVEIYKNGTEKELEIYYKKYGMFQ